MLRERRYARNSSEKAGSSWSTRIIACLSMRTSVDFSAAVAVAIYTRLPGQTPFTEKAPGSSIATIASLPSDEITVSADLARLDIKHGVRRIPLRKENPFLRAGQRRFALADLCEELLGIKRRHALGLSDLLPLNALSIQHNRH